MPAVSSELKDLMSYQLNKFERTTGTPLLPPRSESNSPCEYENLKYPSSLDHLNYENQLVTLKGSFDRCLCSKPSCESHSDSELTISSSPSQRVLNRHHYCPEYEKAVKKSRMIVFGSGGDVIVDKNHGYANTNWLPSTSSSMTSLTTTTKSENQNQDEASTTKAPTNCTGEVILLRRSHNNHSHNHNSTRDSNNFTINVNIPAASDLAYFLKADRLSININITENKNPNSKLVHNDISAIKMNRQLLDQSGWYYKNVDWQESIRMLRNSPVGTFFLRDSGDPKYLFSISVQSTNGPISSRITYSNGKFQLDSQERLASRMPSFSTIIELVEYYTKYGLVKNPSGRQVWVDSAGRPFSPVQLTKPKRKETGSLKHLCRLVLNQHPEIRTDSKSVPKSIKEYLNEYKYTF